MSRPKKPTASGSPMRLSRRVFLKNASLASATLAVGGRALAQVPAPPPTIVPRHTLVYIFLRGGADGLSLCVPYSDPLYQSATLRPNIKITVPAGPLRLTTRWGLSDAMTPLLTPWGNGDLAIVPASGVLAGPTGKERSHFISMDRVEYGIDPSQPSTSGTNGWAARHFDNANFTSIPPLRGMIMQNRSTKTFAGAKKSLAVPDAENFTYPGSDPLMPIATEAMYVADASSHPISSGAAANAYTAFDYLDPANMNFSLSTSTYPASPFGQQFKKLANIILNGNPPEIVEIDLGSWDTHNNQGTVGPGGEMWDLMDDFAKTLEAFYLDLQVINTSTGVPFLRDVSTMAMSEFGRRVAENGSKGTDHGWGGCMFVMGGSHVNGGIYDGGWGGLVNETDGDGDVNVLTDHRDVIASGLKKVMNLGDVKDVYGTNFTLNDPGIFV